MSRSSKNKARDPFVHLNVHSCCTLLSGAARVEEIVAAATLMEMDAIALTDTNAMYGSIPFYQAARNAGTSRTYRSKP